MDRNGSYGSSWADQWDNSPDPVAVSHSTDKNSKNSKDSNNNSANYKQKVGEGLGKTKAVAATGVKKVKEGTSVGFNWIKDKYQKTTQKH